MTKKTINKRKYQKKTIMQVVPALISGGVERGTLEIAKSVVENGDFSIVVSAGGPLVDKLDKSGALHITMNVATKNPYIIWKNSKKLTELITEYDVDVIHARSRAPAWSCLIAARKTGVKLVTTFHGVYNFSTWIKKYYNSIMTDGHRVIAVSNFVKKHIIDNYKTSEDKISVIHRGVDENEFSKKHITEDIVQKYREKYNAPSNAPIILLPSRMTRWKGHLYLIEALRQIKELNFYCIMAGDLAKHPNYVSEIQEKIKEYKLQHRVQLFGNEMDVRSLYGISDIILSTSLEPEAFGRTIIEAQSMEKMVIATNIGGAGETIEDGKTGFHVTPGNADELAEKIKHCLDIVGSKEEEAITMNARKSVSEKFSLKLMLQKTMDLYEKI